MSEQKKSGRKPILDKKKPITIYLEGSKIEKLGGIELLKEKIYHFINNENGKCM